MVCRIHIDLAFWQIVGNRKHSLSNVGRVRIPRDTDSEHDAGISIPCTPPNFTPYSGFLTRFQILVWLFANHVMHPSPVIYT